MDEVALGFKAFDAHELLCHFLAERHGFYRDASLQVRLVDTTFIPEEKLPPDIFQVSCGAALMGRLRGRPYRVVLIATDRPLFWLYSRTHLNLEELGGKRVASFPALAPPHLFLLAILRKRGVDPERVDIVAVRDDTARLGLLGWEQVEAAVASSAVPPALARRSGFETAAFFGEELRVPTTGLAVFADFLERKPDLVERMTRAHRRSLALIQEDPEAVASVLSRVLGITGDLARQVYDELAPCFSSNGTSEHSRQALEIMAREMEIRPESSHEDLYDFRFLPSG